MRSFTLSLILLIASAHAFSQQSFTLIGKVADSSQSLKLENAVVMLSRSADSILSRFVRTKPDGSFSFFQVPAGTYTLSITYPKYAGFMDIITMDKNYDLGTVNMITAAVALQNVIVRGSPIRMRGDTMAFIADSFKVREGDNVEELLKRLPGLQVNSKGEITAMGERVQKVLVDGDEFFGDDPTLATRNIRANMVKEVQVFDRKSDQATFTGVDDGETAKTINLKLKDDAKKGYFGRVNLGGGLPENWKNDAMLNNFKGKKKISAYGLMSSVDKAGLGWAEESNYGGSMNRETEMSDDGGIMMFSRGDDFEYGDNSRNEGLPNAITGGAHFSNKWDDDKQSLNGNYRMRRINTEGGSRTSSQFILPDTSYFNNEQSSFITSRIQHRANGIYDFQIDSSQSVLIKAGGGFGNNQSVGSFESEALDLNGIPVNRGTRTTINDVASSNFNSSALWRKKFKKTGRTLSVNLTQQYTKSEGEGFLRNDNDFFKGGFAFGSDSTDQQKINNSISNQYSGKLSYTEGVGKYGIVELSYQYSEQQSESERLSFDKVDDKYTTLNQLFSNRFSFITKTHNAGTGYRYNYKKINAGIGANISQAGWEQTDLIKDTIRTMNFTNFMGRANLSYKLKQQSSIRFNYNANTRNPSIDQLQPLLDNNNPLFIRVGNPDLKLSFSQRFNLSFNDYKVLTSRSFYANLNFNTVSNDFSNSEVVDSLGRRISKAINVNGNYNYGGYLGYNRQFGTSGWSVGINSDLNIGRNENNVNGLRNITRSQRYNVELSVGHYDDKKMQVGLNMGVAYNVSISSIQPDFKTRFFTLAPNGFFSADMPWDIRLSTNIGYNWRQKTSVFDQNNNALLWNAEISKKLFKKEDLRVGFKINDLLNQNIGFNRQITSNFVTEQNWQIVQRYWLATVTWNFGKNGKPLEW